jgi:hypothetical protein
VVRRDVPTSYSNILCHHECTLVYILPYKFYKRSSDLHSQSQGSAGVTGWRVCLSDLRGSILYRTVLSRSKRLESTKSTRFDYTNSCRVSRTKVPIDTKVPIEQQKQQ